MKVYCMFIDSLDSGDLCEKLAEWHQGYIYSGIPRVTPQVLGSIYTGKSPAEHGLVRPTPLYKPSYQRPDGETIIEKIGNEYKTLSYLMPFTMNMEAKKATICQEGIAQNAQIPPILQLPSPPINMAEDDPEGILQAFVDRARMEFSLMRQLARMKFADVFFVSFRNLDSFTHWKVSEGYRERLALYVALEIEDFLKMGTEDAAILFYSDHGNTLANDVFHINKWFKDRGWLDYTILERRHKKQVEAQQNNFPDQVDIAAPFVEISEDSKAVCCDAFDSAVDIIGDCTQEDIEQIRGELMATGHFDAVYRKEELYPGSRDNEKIPEIIPERKLGHLVCGNVHPNAETGKNIVNSRDGDHSKYGVFGSNMPLNLPETIDRADMYKVIENFVRTYATKSDEQTEEQKEQEKQQSVQGSEEEIRRQLAQLGYI